MLQPFQCLLLCSQATHQKPDILLAASGSYIFSFSLPNGAFLSLWSSEQGLIQAAETTEQSPTNSKLLHGEKSSEQPSKRRKLSTAGQDSESSSAEIITENADETSTKSRRKKKKNKKKKQAPNLAVIKLVGSSNGQYVVATTCEDKCIRVLELSTEGFLKQLSQRHMPKRPCAIVLAPDESKIACADKFGDVYSLPLLVEPSESVVGSGIVGYGPSKDKTEPPPKPFVPSANSRTVHTQRNRQALLDQQNTKITAAKKRTLDFEHQLLLGHVSLLTDLVYVTLDAMNSLQVRSRSYILTCDRDEHIRVSRGLPQAHIIEGYCLGHTEFVNKMYIPHWQRDTLISGGGDDYLLVWDWLSGCVRQKVDLITQVDTFKKDNVSDLTTNGKTAVKSNVEDSLEDQNRKIAITGIWGLNLLSAPVTHPQSHIFVACEGLAALFIYTLSPHGTLCHNTSHPLPGNIIDVSVLEHHASIIYSVDNIHAPSSTTVIASSLSRPSVGELKFNLITGCWGEGGEAREAVRAINRHAGMMERNEGVGTSDMAILRELLYGVENLRKRGQEERGQEDEIYQNEERRQEHGNDQEE